MCGEGHSDPLGALTAWLKDLALRFKAGERPDVIIGPFGAHAVEYGDNAEDDYGPYALVRFGITEAYDMGWFTEIEDGAFGCLMGFRIYLNEIGDA
jgi:hypothetical protein